jgi:hypothetical protein
MYVEMGFPLNLYQQWLGIDSGFNSGFDGGLFDQFHLALLGY